VSKIGLSACRTGRFGSYIAGDFNEKSYIDLLVEFKKPVGWGFFSLQIYLEKVFF
jgi:hypothetical protein